MSYYVDLSGWNEQAREVSALLKDLDLKKEDRQELWEWQQRLWNRVKEIRDGKRREWERSQIDYIRTLEVKVDNAKEALGRTQDNVESNRCKLSEGGAPTTPRALKVGSRKERPRSQTSSAVSKG